jgi:PcfJ-like protein
LRPDSIRASGVFPNKCRTTLLHTIGNKRWTATVGSKCWEGGYEWAVLQLMHSAALARNERFIELKEREERRARRGKSLDEKRLRLYRQIEWGQRKRQFILLNGMIKRLLAEAADPVALQLARRFHPVARENIYRAAAISQRARQLIDIFPTLGLVIYCPPEKSEYWEKARDAAQMVERGVKLTQIAGFMQIPMSARALKPAVAHLFGYPPANLLCYLPPKTWEQRLWLRPFMCPSISTDDPAFALWIARNVLKIGNRIWPVIESLKDVGDWVDEAKCEQPRCITRRFSPDMSWATVQRENSLWHEAIAKLRKTRSRYKIPPPWFPTGHANGYSIVPLDSAEELWKEGWAMHHCVGSYDRRVAKGVCYIYSVRQGDERIATVELVRINDQVRPGQIRGRCNAQPSKEVCTAVRKWLSEAQFDKGRSRDLRCHIAESGTFDG